jgi:hypothetical protein
MFNLNAGVIPSLPSTVTQAFKSNTFGSAARIRMTSLTAISKKICHYAEADQNERTVPNLPILPFLLSPGALVAGQLVAECS